MKFQIFEIAAKFEFLKCKFTSNIYFLKKIKNLFKNLKKNGENAKKSSGRGKKKQKNHVNFLDETKYINKQHGNLKNIYMFLFFFSYSNYTGRETSFSRQVCDGFPLAACARNCCLLYPHTHTHTYTLKGVLTAHAATKWSLLDV